MTELCPGRSTMDAARLMMARGGSTEDWNMPLADFNQNYDCCGEGEELASAAVSCPQYCKEVLDGGHLRESVAQRSPQKGHGVFRVMWCTWIHQWRDSVLHWRSVFLRLDTATRQALFAYAIGFLGLPLLAFFGVVTNHQPQTLLLTLADFRVPALIVIESSIYIGPEFVMYFCLPVLKRAGHVGPFAIWLLMKLLYTAWMLSSSNVNGPLLVSGFKMMRDRAVMASTLYAHDSYSKYLVCSPRRLEDLYGSEICALPKWCHKPSSSSREDILRACACFYEMLATSEHDELIQMHHGKYGLHMQTFVRYNAFGACVWVLALCNALWTPITMIKILLDDMLSLMILYVSYTRQRRRGSTRRDAFHTSMLALLTTRKPLPDAVRLVVGQVVPTAEVQEEEGTEAIAADTTVVNHAPTRGLDAS